MMKTMALAAMLAVAGLTTGAEAQSYKATRDFSYQNPNGVWQYGYGLSGPGGTFTRIPGPLVDKCFQPKEGSDCFLDSDALVSVNTSGKTYVAVAPSSSIVIPNDALRLHPRSDNQEVIIQFRAPAEGEYSFNGFYQILDTNPSSIAPRIFVGAVDVTPEAFREAGPVILAGPGADAAAKKGGQLKRFRFTRTLSKNGVVRFGLGANGDFRFDSTAFDVTATPTGAQ